MSTQIPTILVIPELWDKDWSQAIGDATPGIERQIVLTQRAGADLLKVIEERAFSFERLAWLTLWTKNFWILDSARWALSTSAEYALQVLARVSFELWLHAKTIFEQDSDQRLRAYIAWCIASDVRFQQHLVRPETLDGIWDSRPAEGILNDERILKRWEELYGPLKIDVDQKNLRKGRFRQQDRERHRLHRLKSWLAHADLLPWKLRLDQLAKEQRQEVSFFALVDSSERSVRGRLRSAVTDPHFMYLPYMQGSLWIHGSTMEQIMDFASGHITPRVPRNAESCQSSADGIQHECMDVFIFLDRLRGVFSV